MYSITAPNFQIRDACTNAAYRHGFRITVGEESGWFGFESSSVAAKLWLAAGGADGPWYAATDDRRVTQRFDRPAALLAGPGLARYRFGDLHSLHSGLRRIYELSSSQHGDQHGDRPDGDSADAAADVVAGTAPLQAFRHQIADLPASTEAERLVIQRVGQDIFRRSLLTFWGGRCPLTGIADSALLRASHIVAWSDCSTDQQRLDVYNGLLLSALWDAAFDRHLVSFDVTGEPLFSTSLSPESRAALTWTAPLPLTDQHQPYLAEHRRRFTANNSIE